MRQLTLAGLMLVGVGLASIAWISMATADPLIPTQIEMARIGVLEISSSAPTPGLSPWIGGGLLAAGLGLMAAGLRFE